MDARRFRLLVACCTLLLLTALMPRPYGSHAAQLGVEPVSEGPAPLARLSGTATPDGLPYAGLRVELAQDGRLLELTTTNDQGEYQFVMPTGGTYTVAAFDVTNLPFAIEDVTLTAGETTFHDLGLPLHNSGATLAAATDGPCAPVLPGTATIRGVVTIAANGQPLSGVAVTASGPLSTGATTDATGAYTLTQVVAGNYSISFDAAINDNYLTQYYNNQAAAENADLVAVAEGATVNNINAALTAGAIISGRVTGASNAPLNGVTLAAYRLEGEQRSFVRGFSTNAEGIYTLNRLPAGSYELATTIGIASNTTVRTYLNQTSQRITIADASTTPNINFSLTRGAQISGRITNSEGQGASNVMVRLYDATTNANLGMVGYALFGANGQYSSVGIAPGTYKVAFESSDYLTAYYNNQATLEQATILTLSGTTLTPEIGAELSRGGIISGRVTNSAGQVLSSVNVTASPVGGGASRSVITGFGGTYSIAGLVGGQYEVEFSQGTSTAGQGYITQYYNNQPDRASADPVNVPASGEVNNINAVLAQGGTIGGCISGSDTGRGLANTQVRVRLSNGGGTSQSYRSDGNGVYRTTGLAPGSYHVEFLTPLIGNTDRLPGYLGQNYPTPVVVATTDVTDTNTVLDRGAALRGIVTGVDGQPLNGINAWLRTLNGSSATTSSIWSSATGRYTTYPVVPGRYMLRIGPSTATSPNAAYIEQLLGPYDLSANSFTMVDVQLSLGGQISGRVTNSNGDGLSQVSVRIYDEQDQFVNSFSTNTNGVYTTTGLTDGNYYLQFSPFSSGSSNQYAAQFYNNKLDRASADPVRIEGTAMVPNINATLAIGSVISGQVTAADGASLGNVRVNVYNATGQIISTATTSSDGSYSTAALPSGVYRVCFRPLSGRLIPLCYNNKPTLESADPVTVTAPNPVANINAALAAGSQIRGRVRNPEGEGLAGVVVEVRARISTAAEDEPLATGTTTSDGSYSTAPGLPAGNYQLRFVPPTGSGGSPASLDVNVATTGSDVEGSDVTLSSNYPVYLPLVQR